MRLRSSARRVVPFLIAVLAILLVAAPALAESGHGEKKEGGLSFLDLQRYDLGIFTLIVFGILCAFLWKFAWPKIAEGLEKREKMIAQARDEALAAKREAEEARVKLQNEFAQAQEKIRGMLEEARRDADQLRAKEREAGQKDAAAERDRAKKEIDGAKEAALQEIYQRSIQLAGLMSSKAIRRQLTIEDQNRLLQESLAELKTGVGH
jgi:F-type H+-transporting ATPase subunit b